MHVGTQAVGRAIGVFKLIAAHHPVGVRLTDLSQLSDLEQPTVHRLLAGLMREGLVAQEDGGKKYTLGPYCRQLGQAFQTDVPMQERYGAMLQKIADATGDATFLVVQSGFETLCIARAIGTNPIQALAVSVGHRQPIGVGAGGLAILAELPERDADMLILANRDRLPYYRNLDVKALRILVAMSRDRGYASIGNHAVTGVIGVGVALRNAQNEIIGGVSVAAIEARMPSERQALVARQLRELTASAHSEAAATPKTID